MIKITPETNKVTSEDEVNHPNHYTQYSFEAIDVIDEVVPKYPATIGFYIGTTIKYLLRAPFKGRLTQDLAKAQWYLNKAIEKSKKVVDKK